jgi:type IV secretion system protein VirB3
LAASLVADPICTVLTRPQMFAGVTYSYAVFNLIVTVEAFLISKSFWSLLAAVAIHAVGYFGCLHEPRFFDLWIVRARSCPRVPNHGFWRANSYRP